MNQFFLHILDLNSNSSHMVQDTYAIHLSWHTSQCCGWEANGGEHIFKSERKDREKARGLDVGLLISFCNMWSSGAPRAKLNLQ